MTKLYANDEITRFDGSHKFRKIEYFFIFEMLKKKIWANFKRIMEVFTQKIFTEAFLNMGLGSRGQKGTGSRIPDPDPQH